MIFLVFLAFKTNSCFSLSRVISIVSPSLTLPFKISSATASSTAEVSKSGLKRKLVYSVQEARRILRDQYRFPYNSDDDEQDDRPTPKNQPSEEIEFADDTEVKRRRITRANPRTNRPPSPPASPVSSDYDIGGVSDDSVKDQDYVAENDSEKETDEDTEMEDPLQTEDEETS